MSFEKNTEAIDKQLLMQDKLNSLEGENLGVVSEKIEHIYSTASDKEVKDYCDKLNGSLEKSLEKKGFDFAKAYKSIVA